MGSIVKSIGRVFKGIGKTLKKIAPILLVAAAVYVGYGFATGFTGAGWPTITSWGKSLMGGVTSGNSLSQAASVATQEAPATAAAQTAQTVTDASSSGLVPVAKEVGMGDSSVIADYAVGMGAGGGGGGGAPTAGPTKGILGAVVPQANAATVDAAAAAPASTVAAPASTFDLSTLRGTGPGLESLTSAPQIFGVPADGTSFTWQEAINKFKGKAAEAWKWYKELWKKDPLIALMGTNQVAALIADLMDKEEAKKEFGGMSAEEFGIAMNKYSPGPRALTVGEVQQKYGRGSGGMIGAGRIT